MLSKCRTHKCFYDWNINLVVNTNCLEAPYGDIVSRVRVESLMTHRTDWKSGRKADRKLYLQRIEKTKERCADKWRGNCWRLHFQYFPFLLYTDEAAQKNIKTLISYLICKFIFKFIEIVLSWSSKLCLLYVAD